MTGEIVLGPGDGFSAARCVAGGWQIGQLEEHIVVGTEHFVSDMAYPMDTYCTTAEKSAVPSTLSRGTVTRHKSPKNVPRDCSVLRDT